MGAFSALAAAGLLSACATTAPLESYSPKAVVPTEAMLALSPGAGAILGVVQTGYVNATEQKISLDTRAKSPGTNYFTIQMFEAVAHSATPGGLQDVPLANMDLGGEARGTVNFADMKLSPYFVQNQYGPFGYSMGRTATADLCMYAWQRIAPERKPGGGVARGAINLRALICDQTKTEQELLDIMFQLRIKGVAGVARPAPEDIGAYGKVISPGGGVYGPANVLPPIAPPARPRASAPAAAAPAPAPAPAAQEDTIPSPSSSPLIPSPDGGGDVPIVPTP
ncbi:cellulose biosynthesis protein BcsN [Devosia lucknowensis]|uniref:cellulose biosynthesis protein BcsN n=1 Tax=Devosia lucknowensis TaxID=1096929 RepID=UPI00148218A1|nr:cellulose biosynthesis protein BcsN [Devosia lucknowensis]